MTKIFRVTYAECTLAQHGVFSIGGGDVKEGNNIFISR